MIVNRAVRVVAATATVVGLLAPAGCRDSTAPGLVGAHRRAQVIWAAKGPSSYRITMERSGHLVDAPFGDVVVTVVNGVVESRQFAANGKDLPEGFEDLYPAVEGLFDLIDLFRLQDFDELRVEYDAVLGYPTLINLDRRVQWADDEVIYTVRNFQPL